jgi:hypothetical protein
VVVGALVAMRVAYNAAAINQKNSGKLPYIARWPADDVALQRGAPCGKGGFRAKHLAHTAAPQAISAVCPLRRIGQAFEAIAVSRTKATRHLGCRDRDRYQPNVALYERVELSMQLAELLTAE